jgi:hypothetical protein
VRKQRRAYLGVDVHDLSLGSDQLGPLLRLEALQGALILVEPQELLDVLVDPLVV